MSVVVMSRNGSEQQLGCGQNGCGNHGSLCPTCEKSFTASTKMKCLDGNSRCSDENPCDFCQATKHSLVETSGGAVGGGKARDVVPIQKVSEVCLDCRENPDPTCAVCTMIKSTQEIPPFTKGQVKQLHAKIKSWFCQSSCQSSKDRIFELVVSQHRLLIPSIDWTMHNCAFSVFVLMLSSSNAGMNSINQKTFAGYILAVIINSLQECDKCDPILLEVFRLELSIISGNSSWSDWSELIEIQDLYKVCVNHRIINDNEVEFVLPNDDGSYNISETLNRKHGSTLVGAHKWNPSIYDLSNGILSQKLNSRFRVSAVVLHYRDHFSIVVLSQGIWHIDGKGKQTGVFKAESSIRKLTIEEFQELCASHGVFYFFEEIPFVYETLNLFGRQGLSPRKVSYGGKWYFLYDNGTMICETTGIMVNLQRTVFMTDNCGKHFRVFPAFPPPAFPPQAPCAQDDWVPPPPPQVSCAFGHLVPQPPPPTHCASGQWVPPPPPQVPFLQVAPALPPPPPDYLVVWYVDEYRRYYPQEHVLRSILTDRIIDNIKAGTYRVQEKGTRKMIDIELREVPSDDVPPPPRPTPSAQVFSQIQLADITIRDGEWSIRRDSFSQSGTCLVSQNQYIHENVCYNQEIFLMHLNFLYRNHVVNKN